MIRFVILGGSALSLASTADAATLVHAYEFTGTGVVDSAGGVDGSLFGDASVSGGYLHLDGDGDYVELDSAIVPASSGSYSVYFRYTGHSPQPGTYTEVISQGGGNFYIGDDPSGNVRISDAYLGTGIAMPADGGTHDFLLTAAPGDSHLYIDGVLVFSGSTIASSPYGGSVTRFGRQFSPYGEYFQGEIDAIRLFDGVATYAEASASPGAVPEPASWATMLAGFGLMGGAMRRRAKVRFA